MLLGGLLLSFAFAAAPPAVNDKAAEAEAFARVGSNEYKTLSMNTVHQASGTIYSWSYPSQFEWDPNLGLRNRLNSVIRHIVRNDETVTLNATYTIDQFGRRKTPGVRGRPKFAIVFGCSFGFGLGLNDDETLAYHLGREHAGITPYNYSVSGTAGNYALALIEENRFGSEIPEKTGTFIYVYLDHPGHVDRVAGTYPTLSWMKATPYYVDTPQGMERAGTYATERPWRTWLTEKVAPWWDWRKEGKIFPPVGKSGFQYNCRIIEQARRTFERNNPGSKFLVYVHPLNNLSEQTRHCFVKNSIPFLEGKVDLSLGGLSIPNDGHPTGKLNRIIARQIAEALP